MLHKILGSLKTTVSNDDTDTRRAFERRDEDHCIAMIDDVSFPVENWSKGGLLISGDDRSFGVNEVKNVTMRFKLTNRVMDVEHKATVLRKGREKFVLQFHPLTQNIENQFNVIMDDFSAQEFANSQA